LIIYPAVDGQIPARLQDGALIFSNLMKDFSPAWLNILLGIGLLSAAMSTIDTCGNVVALSLSYDILEPSFQKRLSPDKLNKMARWMSVVAIFIAFVYAVFTESLWDIFYLSSGILTTTVFPALLASFRKKTTTPQIYLIISFGFIGTILFYFLETRGILGGIEPDVLQKTGLGYIIYGFLFSLLGLWMGKLYSIRKKITS